MAKWKQVLIAKNDVPAYFALSDVLGTPCSGCGGTLTAADGYFQSPNYPFAYDVNAECYWLIKVSEGSAIRLTFTTFDIETHGYCEFDYVEVSFGFFDQGSNHRRRQGRQAPLNF